MLDRVILLVEDNPDDEELTLRAFRKNAIENPVIVARDGAEALAYLLGSGQEFDDRKLQPPALVLLDLKLPKVDGLEVLRRLRSEEGTRSVPVVILTTSREETDLQGAYGCGANSYVVKPVDFESFTEAVGRLGGYWMRLNEPPPANHGVAVEPSR